MSITYLWCCIARIVVIDEYVPMYCLPSPPNPTSGLEAAAFAAVAETSRSWQSQWHHSTIQHHNSAASSRGWFSQFAVDENCVCVSRKAIIFTWPMDRDRVAVVRQSWLSAKAKIFIAAAGWISKLWRIGSYLWSRQIPKRSMVHMFEVQCKCWFIGSTTEYNPCLSLE